MIGLETERLSFRQWQHDDYPEFARFFSNEEAAEFVGGKKSAEESWRLMATYIGHYQLNGFGYLAVKTTEDNRLVGTVGIWKSAVWPETELGYWLIPEMQRKGFAFEAAKAVLHYAFNNMKLATIVSYIDERNRASIGLAKKLNAVHDGNIELLNFGRHEVFRYSPVSSAS